MNRKKQVLFTMAGIFAVCLLFWLAMYFPVYYTSYSDKRILDKMEYIDVSYNAYKVTYASFQEKLKAIGQFANTGNGINSVRVNDKDMISGSGYKKINKIVAKEFNELYKCGVVGKKYHMRAGHITSCEKYIMYPSGSKNDIKGITYIKVIYKTKKGKIEVYIDEEYHKIYELEMPYKMYQAGITKILKEEDIKKYTTVYAEEENKKSKAGYTDTKIYNKKLQPFLHDIYYDPYYWFIEGLLEYYDFNIINGRTDISNVPYASTGQDIDATEVYLSGYIRFSDGTAIEAGRQDIFVLQDTEYVQIGIRLADML